MEWATISELKFVAVILVNALKGKANSQHLRNGVSESTRIFNNQPASALTMTHITICIIIFFIDILFMVFMIGENLSK